MFGLYFAVIILAIAAIALLATAYLGEMVYGETKQPPIDIMQGDVVAEPVQNATQPLNPVIVFDGMTVARLREIARDNGIVITSSDRKADIIWKLREANVHA